MIFSFLKYIKPTWYFNLYRMQGSSVFPDPASLPLEFQNQLVLDKGYRSAEAQKRDLSWQAFQKGAVSYDTYLDIESSIPILDEYRFIRKYHKSVWVYYCLLVRILTLHNPIKELVAWFRTRSVAQLNLFSVPIPHPWTGVKSNLVQANPKVSVIIPTLNRYTYLKDVLYDLEQQSYQNFDVIVIDQSESFDADFYKQFTLDLTVKNQEEKALWLARNSAIQISDASYFLLFDDDSRVAADWIANHLKGLDLFDAAISSGQSISMEGQQLPENYQFFKISDLLDTGNVLIKRAVFEKIGLFDRQFEKQRMGDGEFGLRAYLHGFLNISNPYATRLHLKVGTGGLREMGAWDAFRTNKLWAPKPIPSVLYLYRKYFGANLAKWELLKSVPPSMMPYRFKKNKFMLALGSLVSLISIPILILQVVKSWRLSGIKLKQGERIDEIE